MMEQILQCTKTLKEEDLVTEEVADEDDVDVEQGLEESFGTTRNGHILVPDQGDKTRDRKVSSVCSICLSAYQVNDEVSWSANKTCPHVFHEDCIVDWLTKSSRRKQRNREHTAAEPEDPPMLCPCCRQDFVMPQNKNTLTEVQSEETSDDPQSNALSDGVDEVEG
jgi:hypothetical protein